MIAPEIRDAVAEQLADSQSPEIVEGHDKRSSFVWLPAGAFVRPVRVEIGLTDGVLTAITASDLQQGVEVVTGVEMQRERSNSGTPFLPQYKRKRHLDSEE
jgi:HlyD family secretion protein